MPRKATGNTTTPRKRKAPVNVETSATNSAPEQASPEIVPTSTVTEPVLRKVEVNLDEEIRRRAYEIYLQRNGAPGDPHMDWLVAEREVRLRQNGQPLTARAAAHGRS